MNEKNDISKSFLTIRLKIEKLLDEQQGLKNRIAELELECERLKNLTEMHKKALDAAEQNNKLIKLAGVIHPDEHEREKIRNELQRYVRLVDDCIRMLSE